jgi:NAD-dependent DNA ligase
MMDDIASLIRRRRRQILVHSCMYYRLNESIIPDYVYDGWARELAALHTQYPEIASQVEFAEEFADFTGESVTGFNLPIHLPEIVATATRLLKYHKQLKASANR